MGMVGSYLKAFADGVACPFRVWTFAGAFPWDETAGVLGHKHGCWLGRWLHGKPTQAMIYKIFVLVGGILIGLGYVCWDTYYRPITGVIVGTMGLLMFALWGISADDLKDGQ